MSVFLPWRNGATCSIAVCARCKMKYYYDDLGPDPNFPGLRVCDRCTDQFDPYRLPALQPENIALRFPRPDAGVSTDPAGSISENGLEFFITQDGEDYFEP